MPTGYDNSGVAGRLSDLSVSHARAVRSNGAKEGASRTVASASEDDEELAGMRRRHSRSPVLPAGSSSFSEALSRASGSLEDENCQQFTSTEPSYSFMRLASAGAGAIGGSPNASVFGNPRSSTPLGAHPGMGRAAPHGFEGMDLGTPVVGSGSPAEIDVHGGYLNENASPGVGLSATVSANLSRPRLSGVEMGVAGAAGAGSALESSTQLQNMPQKPSQPCQMVVFLYMAYYFTMLYDL